MKFSHFILFLIVTVYANGQVSINSGNSGEISSDFEVYWSLGEVFSSTLVGDYMLSQGILQPGNVQHLSLSPITKVEYNVSVYPNPTRDYLNVKGDLEFKLGQITLYNYSGQVLEIFETESDEIQLDMKSYPPGVYFIEINPSTLSKELIEVIIQ